MSDISLGKCAEIGKRVLTEAWDGEPADEYEARQLGARVTRIVVESLNEEERRVAALVEGGAG